MYFTKIYLYFGIILTKSTAFSEITERDDSLTTYNTNHTFTVFAPSLHITSHEGIQRSEWVYNYNQMCYQRDRL